jgi:hypothetical protein
MSVRIVTHAVAIPLPQVVRRRRWVKYHQPVERVRLPRASVNESRGPEPARRGPAKVSAWPGPSRSGGFARFEDDRDLTGLKVAIVGLVIVIVMLLEVPW